MSMLSPPPVFGPGQESYSSPQVTVVLTVILLIFFFVGFFSVYFCRCFSENVLATWNNRLNSTVTNATPNASQNAVLPGLDIQIIQTFPKFKYSAVKDLRKGKIALECAICLSEFVDDDFLRLLTICCHVFHQDCVDLWLESHKTCPVCRANLDAPLDEKSKAKVSDNNTPSNEVHLHPNPSDGSVRISIKEDEDEDENENENENTRTNVPSVRIFIQENETSIQSTQSNLEAASKRRAIAEKFSKCHSTGHSIFRNKVEDSDKYTLRLPDHIREQITSGHQWVKSSTHFGEISAYSDKQGNGFGEMSGTSSGGDDGKV